MSPENKCQGGDLKKTKKGLSKKDILELKKIHKAFWQDNNILKPNQKGFQTLDEILAGQGEFNLISNGYVGISQNAICFFNNKESKFLSKLSRSIEKRIKKRINYYKQKFNLEIDSRYFLLVLDIQEFKDAKTLAKNFYLHESLFGYIFSALNLEYIQKENRLKDIEFWAEFALNMTLDSKALTAILKRPVQNCFFHYLLSILAATENINSKGPIKRKFKNDIKKLDKSDIDYLKEVFYTDWNVEYNKSMIKIQENLTKRNIWPVMYLTSNYLFSENPYYFTDKLLKLAFAYKEKDKKEIDEILNEFFVVFTEIQKISSIYK